MAKAVVKPMPRHDAVAPVRPIHPPDLIYGTQSFDHKKMPAARSFDEGKS
jgi:hypothetical protein